MNEVDILLHATEIDRDQRRVRSLRRSLNFGLPDRSSRHFVEGHDRPLLPTGRTDQLVIVDQHRLADPPSNVVAAELLKNVLLPDDVTLLCVGADQVAVGSESVNVVLVDGRRSARAVSRPIVIGAAGLGGPERFPGGDIEGQQHLVVAAIAHREELAVGNRDAGVAQTQPGLLPRQLRSVGGPTFEQPLVGRDVVSIRSTILRPFALGGRGPRTSRAGRLGGLRATARFALGILERKFRGIVRGIGDDDCCLTGFNIGQRDLLSVHQYLRGGSQRELFDGSQFASQLDRYFVVIRGDLLDGAIERGRERHSSRQNEGRNNHQAEPKLSNHHANSPKVGHKQAGEDQGWDNCGRNTRSVGVGITMTAMLNPDKKSLRPIR